MVSPTVAPRAHCPTARISTVVTLSLAAVLLVLPSFASDALAQTERITKITVTLPAFVSPSCNGEDVIFDATTVAFEHTTLDNSGGSHKKIQKKVAGAGTGLLTGAKYRLSTVSNTESQMTNPPGTVTDTLTSSTSITGQGPANNLLTHVTSKLTMNNLGVVTVDFVQVRFECPSDGTLVP